MLRFIVVALLVPMLGCYTTRYVQVPDRSNPAQLGAADTCFAKCIRTNGDADQRVACAFACPGAVMGFGDGCPAHQAEVGCVQDEHFDVIKTVVAVVGVVGVTWLAWLAHNAFRNGIG